MYTNEFSSTTCAISLDFFIAPHCDPAARIQTERDRGSFGTVSFGRESADGNERYQHPLVSTNNTFLSDEENDSHPKLLSIHAL
jgi:hypothetical protein